LDHFFAFLFLLTLFVIVFVAIKFLANFMVFKVNSIQNKHIQKKVEKEKEKKKLLNAISTIHSANNSNALNGALKNFRQSIQYHQAHNLKFLDKDLGRLNNTIEKFTKYKAFKLYGLDQQKDALREYKLYLKQSHL
jgi:ABC-type bacteriocin/lantibiotic exporter with double-glycine peptidase domain